MDPRIFQASLQQQLDKLVKLTTSNSDSLNRFKQCFNSLSGKEIDQTTFEKVERFKAFLVNQKENMLSFKSLVERAMTKKVECDNAKTKCFEALADLEELIAGDQMIMKY
jgi:tRNA U54 and U55 pseudouridine synthase Pus10